MTRHVAVPCLLIRAAVLLCLLHILHACMKIVGDAAQLLYGVVVQRLLCHGQAVRNLLMVYLTISLNFIVHRHLFFLLIHLVFPSLLWYTRYRKNA